MIIELRTVVTLAIILLVAFMVMCWARMRMGFYTGKKTKKECKEIAKKKHRFVYLLNGFIANIVIPLLIVNILCDTVVYARLHTSVDSFVYLENDLATQRDIEVLFNGDTINTEEDEKKEEYTNRLHIPERFVGKNIDIDMYEFFVADLSLVYVNGAKDAYAPLPEIESGNAEYDYLDDENIQEAKRYKDAYIRNPNLAALYQYGRELSEFEPKESYFPFELTFTIMSDSLWSLESFLQYEDRNVGDRNSYVVIDAYWVAFLSGKMFLRNAKLIARSDTGADYSSCFFVESFVSFEISSSQIDASNKDYAKISYYVGNSGESLLSRIDRDSEPELYNKIGGKAMLGYQEALRCYETDPDFYEAEQDIFKNIKNGINTLMDLGISAE